MPPAPTPTANAPHPNLQRYIDFFFSEFQQQTGKAVNQLARLKILAGVYVEAAEGATATAFGVTVRPTHMLRVAKQPIRRSGSSFSTAGVQLTPGQFTEQDLFYLQELGDAVSDDEPTLRRILANVEDGPAWATSIANATNRSTLFQQKVANIAAAPDGSPSNDVNAIRTLLYRHFTYDDEDNYFAKWAGAGRNYPADVSEAYKQKALREVLIGAGDLYCLGLVPEKLLTAGADDRAMREFLVKIERGESENEEGTGETLTLVPIYSIAADPRTAGKPAFHQFCFFHAFAGEGVNIPDSAGHTVAPGLTAFLATFRRREQIQAYIEGASKPNYFFEGAVAAPDLKMRLFGTLRDGATLNASSLPAGVEVEDLVGGNRTAEEGPVEAVNLRRFLCPPDKIVELAAHPDIVALGEVAAADPYVSQARTDLDLAGLKTVQTAMGLTGDGNNVLVGVIDSGIDGSHPAFTGRIHAVWDQTLPRQNPPTVPGGNFGRVLTGADIATLSVDPQAHGTHVSGIAAGAASPPAYTEVGIAPRARLCVVRVRDFGQDNVIPGVRWIFQQARALGVPAVINMSFGGHFHDHDGRDDLSRQLRGLIRDAAGNWRPGQLLVAAAGNERGVGLHVHTANLPVPTRVPPERPFPALVVRETHPEAMTTFEIVVRPGVVTGVGVGFPFFFFGVPIDPAQPRCNMAIRVELASGAGGWAGWVRQQPNNNPHVRRIGNTRVMITNGRQFAGGLGIFQSQPVLILGSRRRGLPIDSGVWRVQIFNDGPSDIEVHGYSPLSDLRFAGHEVSFRNGSERNMIGSPACAEGVISVGSTCNRDRWTRSDGTVVINERRLFDAAGAVSGSAPERRLALSSFSNSGPVRRTRNPERPLDVVAPGGGIAAARSAQLTLVGADVMVNDRTVVFSGTSMAAPVVTGLAACLLEQRPAMTYAELQTTLRSAATMPAGGTADDFGAGVINARALAGAVVP